MTQHPNLTAHRANTAAANKNTTAHDVIYDAVIIGGGPVGLFAIFELGLVGLRAAVVDVLPQAGGQCIELYPDKPIFDIPGVPKCTGAELTQNLLKQAAPFHPVFFLGERVVRLTATTLGLQARPSSTSSGSSGSSVSQELDGSQGLQGSQGWEVALESGKVLQGRTVVIATGAGEFTPKRLDVDTREPFEGRSLFYAVPHLEKVAQRRVLVVGGGDSAVDWALTFMESAHCVYLVHRRADYRASPASVVRLQQKALEQPERLRLVTGQVTQLEGSTQTGTLQSATIALADPDGSLNDQTLNVNIDLSFVFYGLTIKSGPLVTASGLAHERGLIVVDTERFATNLPGVFAIGDANTYPGKLKLILCGFHEAALMARAAYKHIHDGAAARFEYTTTSSQLRARLTPTPHST